MATYPRPLEDTAPASAVSRRPLALGPLEVTPGELGARANGRWLKLTALELALLMAFARRAHQIVPRAELFAEVWGGTRGGTLPPRDRSVDVYVRKLRVKLARELPGWTFIHTHFGLGYRFSPEFSPDAQA